MSSPLWTSSSSSDDGEIIDKSKCVLDYIIKIRHMFAFTEFKEIVCEFESNRDMFYELAEKFLDHHDSSCLDVSMRKCVIKNSVSKERLKRVREYETRVKEMILLRSLHDCETEKELEWLDFKRNQLGDEIVDVCRSVTEEVCATRWEQRLVRYQLQDPPEDDTSSSSSMADENDLGFADEVDQESTFVDGASSSVLDDIAVNNVGLEQQRAVGYQLQDPPKDDTSSSSMADENDLGFADEVDQESTLVDGASSSALVILAGINQDLRQLNDLLKQHAPPEEVAQELSSSLLDGDSRSTLDNLVLIKRDLQQINEMLRQQVLPQEEIAQESSNSESVDDNYDAVNNSGLQQVDDPEDAQRNNHVVESPQLTLLDGVLFHNHEMQNIESVVAYENVAMNNVGLEQGADRTEILLTEQGQPEEQLVQELLTGRSQNNATNEYDVVTNIQGLQQGDDQNEVAKESSSVALVHDQIGDAPESSSVARVHCQNEVTKEPSAVGFVDDKAGVALESSCVVRVDDQNEVAEGSPSVGVVDDVLVNNPGLQPVDAREDKPPEGDIAEIWRRKVGVVGTHGDGRFSFGEYFRFIDLAAYRSQEVVLL